MQLLLEPQRYSSIISFSISFLMNAKDLDKNNILSSLTVLDKQQDNVLVYPWLYLSTIIVQQWNISVSISEFVFITHSRRGVVVPLHYGFWGPKEYQLNQFLFVTHHYSRANIKKILSSILIFGFYLVLYF